MATVFVLDGEQRSALAATRSLSAHGHNVIVGSHLPVSLAGQSKYCFKSVIYANPSKNHTGFVKSLEDNVSLYGIDVIIPMTDVTAPLVMQSKDALRGVSLPLPDLLEYTRASDKWELMKLAAQFGVPIPQTVFCELPDDALSPHELAFPLIVKPARSKIAFAQAIESTEVLVAKDENELAALVKEISWLRKSRFMLQEKVDGTGQGIFAVYDNGNPIAFFAHKRLREKPPQGGVSVLCESCAPNSKMQAYAERLLTALNWHGTAMVEFKVADDATPYLMEINGRLWGSLQLAVRAGFDVPNMLVQLALRQPVTPPGEIRTGLRNRWLLGDFDHLLLQLRGKGTAASIGAKFRSLLAFLNFFDPRTRLEVFRWSDPKPFLHELRLWLKDLFRRSNA